MIEILNRINFIIMDNVFNNVRFGRNIIVIINILIIIYETTFSFKRSMFDIVAIFINFTLGLFLTFICYSSCYYFVIYKIGPSLSSQKLLEVLYEGWEIFCFALDICEQVISSIRTSEESSTIGLKFSMSVLSLTLERPGGGGGIHQFFLIA